MNKDYHHVSINYHFQIGNEKAKFAARHHLSSEDFCLNKFYKNRISEIKFNLRFIVDVFIKNYLPKISMDGSNF